jgi:hypothetical protein
VFPGSDSPSTIGREALDQLKAPSSIEISAKPTMPARASREAEAGIGYPAFWQP